MEATCDYGDIRKAQLSFTSSHRVDCKWPFGTSEFKFHQSILNGDYIECRRLIKYKPSIDLNQINERGFTPLQESLFLTLNRHSSKQFNFLLKRGADYSKIDFNKGRDSLGWAYCLGRQHEVDLIFNAVTEDVDYKRVDWDGNSYLHLAVISGCTPLTRNISIEMKKFGISVDHVTNVEGLTPYLLAYRLGYLDIAELLEKFGAGSTQLDSKTFLSRSDWAKIGQRERTMQLKEMNRKDKNHQMINGRLQKQKKQPCPISIPTIFLLTSDDKAAITGIDSSGRNYTYQVLDKSPEASNLSKQLILKRCQPMKRNSNSFQPDDIDFVIRKDAIRESLPNLMNRLSIQRLPCYLKEVKPPKSAGETKGILKKIVDAKEKEAQYKQRKQRKSVAFSRRRSSRLISLMENTNTDGPQNAKIVEEE